MADFIEPGKVIVISEYANIRGGYESTSTMMNGADIYYNSVSKVNLFKTKKEWVLGPKVSEQEYYIQSKPTSCMFPYEAEWKDLSVNKFTPLSNPQAGFVDTEFDAVSKSLGKTITVNANWMRGTHLRQKEIMTLFDKIEPNDILQGGLGDCWLLSALASLAEFPSSLKNVFTEDTIKEDGKYVLKLYDASKKDWIQVTIDDRIPCTQVSEWYDIPMPLYSRPNGNELYILLIEKAFAKMSGGYDKLNGGHPASAWVALTGCEDIDIWSRQGSNWIRFSFNVDAYRKNPWDFQNVPGFQYKNEQKNYDDMFKKLKEFDSLNYVMEAAIITNSAEKEHQRIDGLIELHAYSMIAMYDDGKHQLVQLRNPWGNQHEWNGAWSDNSNLWEKYPEVSKNIGLSRKMDGLFWMTWSDCTNIYNNFQVCKKTFVK